MTQQNIGQGAGKLKDGADLVRQAQTKFDKDAASLEERIRGMANGWQGEGGNAFQGLAQAWKQRHQRITRVLGNLADNLDATERDTTQNDANIGQGVNQIARGLDV